MRKNIRLDIQNWGTIDQVDPFEKQAIVIDFLKLTKGKTNIIGTVRAATTEDPHFDFVFFAGREDFALDLLVCIFVKDENDPDVGELLQIFQRALFTLGMGFIEMKKGSG